MKKTLLAAAMALLTTAGYAQFVSQTPAGGFDLNSGKDYIPVYMPAPQLSQIQGKILTDNNLDPDQVNNSLDFWIDDWNGKNASKVQAYVVPEGTVEKNSWGGTEYIGIQQCRNGRRGDIIRQIGTGIYRCVSAFFLADACQITFQYITLYNLNVVTACQCFLQHREQIAVQLNGTDLIRPL